MCEKEKSFATKPDYELTGAEARIRQLENLYAKLDQPGAGPKKTVRRMSAAGFLASKIINEDLREKDLPLL